MKTSIKAARLSTEAVSGIISLENVFRFPGSKSSGDQVTSSLTGREIISSNLDVTVLDLVSIPIARNLFDS